MKKLVVFLLAILAVFGMAGCTSANDDAGIVSPKLTETTKPDNITSDKNSTEEPAVTTHSVSVDDFMEEKSFGEYLNLDAYAKEMGYEAIVIEGVADGLYCETPNGVFLIQFLGDMCRFYAPTAQEGIFQSYQVLHTVNSAKRDGEELKMVMINSTIWEYGYRVVDAVKVWLEWIAVSDDIYNDPFVGVPHNVGSASNIQIGPDPDAVRLSGGDFSDLESRN